MSYRKQYLLPQTLAEALRPGPWEPLAGRPAGFAGRSAHLEGGGRPAAETMINHYKDRISAAQEEILRRWKLKEVG